MFHLFFYLQSNHFGVASHPTEPVVAQDSEHADFQHQVSRSADVSASVLHFVKLSTSESSQNAVPLLFLPADGDVCAYGRRVVVLHPGCEVEEAGQQQVDEGDHHGESQQAGLSHQGVLGGTTGALRLLGGERERPRAL